MLNIRSIWFQCADGDPTPANQVAAFADNIKWRGDIIVGDNVAALVAGKDLSSALPPSADESSDVDRREHSQVAAVGVGASSAGRSARLSDISQSAALDQRHFGAPVAGSAPAPGPPAAHDHTNDTHRPFGAPLPLVVASPPLASRLAARSTAFAAAATCLRSPSRNQGVNEPILDCSRRKLMPFSRQESNAGHHAVSAVRKTVSCDGHRLSDGRSHFDVYSTFILRSKIHSDPI